MQVKRIVNDNNCSNNLLVGATFLESDLLCIAPRKQVSVLKKCSFKQIGNLTH